MIVDLETLKNRLARRTTNDFGKTPEELREILESHKGYEERREERGSVLMDAAQPINTVVNQILAQSGD